MRMPPSRPKASVLRMTGLLSELLQIATLRRSPANLPSSWASVAAFVLLYAAVDVMIILLDDGYRVVARTVLDVAISLAVVGFLLAVTGRLHRLPQTLVAVYGAYVLLSPAMAALLLARLPARSNEAIALFATAGSVLVVLWYLLIVGHVLRSALDTGLATGFAIAVTWTVASVALSQTIFGSAA
jgi:hypothetical protein